MADFIYLLQNRLTPAQWRALETVREAARAHGTPVFLVGGAVRDLTTGSPVRDLDFAVQGDSNDLIPELEAAGATITGKNGELSSLYLTFRGGVRGELGSSVTVSYPKPGQPEAHSAPILDDLRRRDFTANSMAVSLNEGSYGLLLDPLNGTADIENRELRLVSAYGFVEQPALLLRAARLRARLGWNLEERTATRYQSGKDEGYIQALPAADRGYELEEIFHEEDPLAILEQMEAEGWRDVLFPHLRAEGGDETGLDHVRDLIGQLEAQGIHPDPSAIYFPLITAKLSDKDRSALKGMFARPGFAKQIDTIETRARELGAQLTAKAATLPSDSWRLLMGADPELVLWLAVHVRTGAVQSKIKAFLKEWPQMRQKIPYALMQEMRITPDLPGYDKLLDDLFFALIDGKLDTPEATRAFLEPYSPPAPPQITVRRRPAKSARGRKRVAEEVVPEAVDEHDASESEDSDSSEDGDDDSPRELGTESRAQDRSDRDDEEEEEPEPPAPKVKAEPARPAPPKESPAAPKSLEAAPSAAEVEAPAHPKAPAKVATPAKQPPAKAPAPVKAAAKAAVAKHAAPQKAVPAKPIAKTPAKAPGKSATPPPASKSAPAKGKAAAKKVVSAPPKKVAAKIAPKKVVPTKSAAVKTAPKSAAKKVAAKKQAVKGKSSAPAKGAKKVAAKHARR